MAVRTKAVNRSGITSEVVREIVERTRREQGLPPVVEDHAALSKIAEILYFAARDDVEGRL